MSETRRPSSYVVKSLDKLNEIDFSDGTIYGNFDDGIKELGDDLCLSTLTKVEKALSDRQEALVASEKPDGKAIKSLGSLILTCRALIKLLDG